MYEREEKTPEKPILEDSEVYIRYAIKQFNIYGVSPEITRALILAESGADATALNPEPHKNRNGEVICYGSYGLFQVACSHYLQNPERLYDPYFNVDIAVQVLKSQGITAWGAYTSGAHLKYLN